MLKLYTNKEYLTEKYRRQVFPLLFDIVFKKDELVLNYYQLVEEVVECDIIIMPIDYAFFIKQSQAFRDLLKMLKINKKPLWVYSAGDYGYTNYIANTYTFRLGGFNSKLEQNVFIMPSFICDPYKKQLTQGFLTLKKEKRPNIGFVGHAQLGVVKYMKELLSHFKYNLKRVFKKVLVDAQPFYASSIKRAKFLVKLSKSDELNTQFILRNNYRAGSQAESNKQKSTKEFYNNMFNNPYTFCSRGVGNFSVRFYETLAVGRIPILLNTDCRLPLREVIDWSKHCLILDEKSKQSFESQILEFHNNLDADAFIAIQQSNRELWLNKLERNSYFVEVYKQFKAKKE